MIDAQIESTMIPWPLRGTEDDRYEPETARSLLRALYRLDDDSARVSIKVICDGCRTRSGVELRRLPVVAQSFEIERQGRVLMSMSAEQITQQMNDAAPHARELLPCIESAFSIECIGCGNEEIVLESSKWAAAIKFASGGWRIDENEARCGECIEADNA